MKNYKKMETFPGDNLEQVVEKLLEFKQQGKLVLCDFNGKTLYSDIDDMDSAFKKVTGKTKTEFDKAERKRHEDYLEEKRKHEESIPEKTKEWIEKGEKILDKRYIDLWKKCVPVRLKDLYRGFELGACLEIVEKLNNNEDFDSVKEVLYNQGHSGMSFGLICSMLRSFCDKGEEFVNYVK